MAGGRSVFALASIFLVAGSIVLSLFVLLGGGIDGAPVNRFYFLRVDTRGIPNAPDESRWTFWNICATGESGRNQCGRVHPAFPLDPPSGRNFGTTSNVPDEFVGTRQYFYMTRFMFAFDLIYIIFAVGSLIVSGLALFTRIGSYIAGFLAFIATFFSAITCSLMTAAYVKGRNNFNRNDQEAHLGRWSFGFMWAAFACLFLSSLIFCGPAGRKTESTTSYRWRRHRSVRSTRSRGSFIDRKDAV